MNHLVPSSDGKYSLWQLVSAAVGSGIVCAGAAWTVGRAYLGDELAQYQRAKSWKVPDAIRHLSSVSEKLSLTLKEREELERGASEIKKLRDKLVGREDLLAKSQKELQVAMVRLKEYEPDVISVEEGESGYIAGAKLVLGVYNVEYSSRTCSINFGNSRSSLEPGQSLDASDGKNAVKITLLDAGLSKCRFAIKRNG
jgi:hypothetical protein